MGGRGTGSASAAAARQDFAELAKAFTYDAAGFRHPDLLGEDGQREVQRFDNYLDSMNFDGDIYRGIRLSDGQFSELHVGEEIDQLGISSWSYETDVADGFATRARRDYGSGVPVVFVLEGGTNHGADISMHSSRWSEGEVALSSRSKQVITKIETPEYNPQWDMWMGVAKVYLKEVK